MENMDLRELSGSLERMVCRDQGYFPVVVRIAGDQLVAVLRGGAGHVGVTGRLDVVRSQDGGKTWTVPEVVVNSEADDRNPALGVAADGSVVLAYHAQASYEEDGKWAGHLGHVRMMVTRSSDGGMTWETPWDLGYTPMEKHSAFGRIVSMPDGTLLLPVYGSGIEPGAVEENHSYVLRSTDKGRTWGKPSLLSAGHNETALLYLSGENLIAAMRSADKDQRLDLCRSSDGGRTWTTPEPVTEAREHPADLVLLSNGWLLMVFGVRHAPFGVQAMVSKDGGHTWGDRLVVCDGLGDSDLGYPSCVLVGDQLVTLYYCGPRRFDEPEYRGEGSFCRALIVNEEELIRALR